MPPRSVIAIIDVGKTNKKLFLFDEDYNIVYERSARFIETTDEDGDPCENLESLRISVKDSLKEISRKKEFKVKAINFSAYGASFVYIDDKGEPVTPLYNYLKTFPTGLSGKFYRDYGGRENFSLRTASPVLGSLNSGFQLYRLKHERPELFDRIQYALHLPQYLSWLVCGKAVSEITSIGCHTGLWNFQTNDYDNWVKQEGLDKKFPPVVASDDVFKTALPAGNVCVGVGLHDSSAALVPYLAAFKEPFILLSTGTWCISLNPFNDNPLTASELQHDCLCYLQYKGRPVKASRYFAGPEYEEGISRIADHFQQNIIKYRSVEYDPAIVAALEKNTAIDFSVRDLSSYSSDIHAYHQLVMDVMHKQVISTQLLLEGSHVTRLFVDGGFSQNAVYMNLLANAFPSLEVYSASMGQASAIGAALCIHKSWNKKPVSNTLIKLQYYAVSNEVNSEPACRQAGSE
jgi:sugar (pentulose or hexulose) kinase